MVPGRMTGDVAVNQFNRSEAERGDFSHFLSLYGLDKLPRGLGSIAAMKVDGSLATWAQMRKTASQSAGGGEADGKATRRSFRKRKRHLQRER